MMCGVPFIPAALGRAGSVEDPRFDPQPSIRWRIAVGAGAGLLALLFPAMHPSGLHMVWNVSASVPVGLYRIVPDADPRPSELVAVRPAPALARFMAARRYVEAGALLVKPVAAVAGQQVCRAGATITVDGAPMAVALAVDRSRRPMPIWTGCARLRPGMMFLLAPKVPASFDGRYFGPVATSSIVGRALPLWTHP